MVALLNIFFWTFQYWSYQKMDQKRKCCKKRPSMFWKITKNPFHILMWKKKNEKKICKSVQYFQTYFLVFTFSHDLQWPLISFFFLSLGFSKSWSFQQWWWWWWWWWTIFVEWLNEKLSVAFFQLGLLSEILIITNLWYAVSRIWTWAEPEFRLWWMKLCSSDNNYTIAPQRVPWECQKSDLNFRSCCCKLFQ